MLLHEWPLEWWERYFSKGYLFVDPAIRHVVSDAGPFLWSDLDPMCRDDPAATRVMREAYRRCRLIFFGRLVSLCAEDR